MPPFRVLDIMQAAAAEERAGRDIIRMDAGQPSLGAPRRAIEAAEAALRAGPLGYTPALGVPALRERRDDIPQLLRTFLSNGRNNAPHHHFSPEAMAVLIAYHWPGNVRELENAVERMVVLAGQRQELGVADLPAELRSSEQGEVALSDDRYEAARARFDHLYFQNLLRRSAGNVTEAARLAGISRGHLHRRMKELGVTP